MRLTKEVTEELVKEVAGEDTIKLVGLLRDEDNISEFKLAEKLRITVNTVRNMLYRLQAHNLVTSIRKKDKKKGWYIYYWTFNTPQARSLIRVVKQKKLEQLKERLKTETEETFYVCPEKCIRFKMVHAMDYDFKCPECGHVLQEEDNQEFVEKLKASIMGIEEDLAKPVVEVRTMVRKRRGRRLAGRGRPKLVKRGRPKLKKRGRPRLVEARRGSPKLKKRGRHRLIKARKPRLKRVRQKLTTRKKVRKRKPVKIRKAKMKKIKRIKKPKTRKRKLHIKKPKLKKGSLLKKVRKFLRKK